MDEPPRLLPERPSLFASLSGAMRKSLGFKLLLVGGILVALFAVLAAERLAGTAAHPVQYFVAALAFVLFGMLLLSLSEHMAFAAAFALAALVVAGMTGAYAGAVFRRRAAALSLGGLALASYAVMFAVLRVESMALLLGTLVLVGILAFLMALTAKMNR